MQATTTALAPAVLSPEERAAWDRDGYLHVRGVLSDQEIQAVLPGIDQLVQADGLTYAVAGNDRDKRIANAVAHTAALDPLLDHPGVFGKVLSLIGPYLQITATDVVLRQVHSDYLFRLHTDGGDSLRHIFPAANSLAILVKAQFFLTDVSQPDSGNFVVVPGSHLRPFPVDGLEWTSVATDAVQVLAAPGDVVLFAWSVWHGVAPNRSGRSRKSVILRYAPMWCRPTDYQTQAPATLERLTLRRRRLFGDFQLEHVPNDYYRPAAKHDQLNIMLGDEWKDHEAFRMYYPGAKPTY